MQSFSTVLRHNHSFVLMEVGCALNLTRINMRNKIIAGTVALAFLTFVSGKLQAQVTCVVTIKATISVPSTHETNNGSIYTIPSPTKVKFDTKEILKELAVAENLAGHYPATTFPSGAKLAAVCTQEFGSSPDFEVLDKNNNVLVHVNDILSAASDGKYGSAVLSGKGDNGTNFSHPTQTDLEIYTIAFDDTAIVGSSNIKLYFAGLMTSVITNSTPNRNTGSYKQSHSYKLPSGSGDGVYTTSAPIVVTGSYTATGNITF